MDRQMLKDQLGQAELGLAELAVRIEKQEVLINHLEAAGYSTAHAAFLLQQYLGLQKLQEAHLDRLKCQLASVSPD